MSIQYYPNGIGGYPPGDFLDTCKPLLTSGNVWYVSSLIGTDAVSPAGQNREKPLKTLANAVASAAEGDIIVFLPGHTETLTLAQTIGRSLTLIGEGVIDGKPAVSFKGNSAAATLISAISTGIEFRNLYFPPNLVNNTAPRILAGADDFVMRGCYVDCGATDQAAAVRFSGNRFTLDKSTFISTATLTSAQPKLAIEAGTGAVIEGVLMTDVEVSAGTVGFSNYAAVDLTKAGVLTRLQVEGMSLLLGADMAIHPFATGRVNVQLATGGSRVSWA